MRNYSRPSPAFSCCRWGKAGWGLGMRLDSIYPCANSPSLVRNELKALQVFYFGSGEGRKTFTWLLPRGITVNILMPSLVPRLLCRRGGKRAWYTIRAAPSSLSNLLLLHYTKITVNFGLHAERPHCIVILILPVGHKRVVLRSKTISPWQQRSALLHSRWLVKLQREILSVQLRQAQLFFPKVCMHGVLKPFWLLTTTSLGLAKVILVSYIPQRVTTNLHFHGNDPTHCNKTIIIEHRL